MPAGSLQALGEIASSDASLPRPLCHVGAEAAHRPVGARCAAGHELWLSISRTDLRPLLHAQHTPQASSSAGRGAAAHTPAQYRQEPHINRCSCFSHEPHMNGCSFHVNMGWSSHCTARWRSCSRSTEVVLTWGKWVCLLRHSAHLVDPNSSKLLCRHTAAAIQASEMVWRRQTTQHECLTIAEHMPTAVHCGLVAQVQAEATLPVLHSSLSHVMFTRPQSDTVRGSLPFTALIAA